MRNRRVSSGKELIKEGFPLIKTTEKVVAESDGRLSIPLSDKIAELIRLKVGQKVETVAADSQHILVTVS